MGPDVLFEPFHEIAEAMLQRCPLDDDFQVEFQAMPVVKQNGVNELIAFQSP